MLYCKRLWSFYEKHLSVYTFTLPRGALYGLRLDPGIYSGMQFRLESVIINEPVSYTHLQRSLILEISPELGPQEIHHHRACHGAVFFLHAVGHKALLRAFAHIDQIVSNLNHIQVVFYDNHGIPLIHQFLYDFQ